MVSSVTLNDKSGAAVTIHSSSPTAKRVIAGAHGLIGIPPVRASIRPRPTAHGSIDDTRWTDGALVVLEGEITSDTSIADCLAEFRTITTPMLQTLDNGPALLKWTEGESVSDDFASNTVGNYGFDAGSAADVSISSGRLNFVSGEPETYHTQWAPRADGDITWKFNFGDLVGSSFAGANIKRQTNGDRIRAFAIDGSGLFLQEYRGGVAANLATASYTFLADTDYWVRAMVWGNHIVLDLFTSAPTPTSASVARAEATLTGAPKTAFGEGVAGRIGFYGRKHSSACWIDDLTVTGLPMQRLVKLAGEIDPPITGVGAYLTYQAQFLAADPRAYSQTEVTTVGASLSVSGGGLVFPDPFPWKFNESSGGAATWTQAGNRPTLPTFKIYGACSSPRLRLLSTGEEIVLTGEVSAGDYLELGTDSRGQRYVRLNGTTNRANLLDFTSTTWFEIPPGPQTVQLLATTFDGSAHVEVLTRAAYA